MVAHKLQSQDSGETLLLLNPKIKCAFSQKRYRYYFGILDIKPHQPNPWLTINDLAFASMAIASAKKIVKYYKAMRPLAKLIFVSLLEETKDRSQNEWM